MAVYVPTNVQSKPTPLCTADWFEDEEKMNEDWPDKQDTKERRRLN